MSAASLTYGTYVQFLLFMLQNQYIYQTAETKFVSIPFVFVWELTIFVYNKCLYLNGLYFLYHKILNELLHSKYENWLKDKEHLYI